MWFRQNCMRRVNSPLKQVMKGKKKMIKQKARKPIVQKRHRSIRVKLSGTAEFPRLAVLQKYKTYIRTANR